jgi:hypothetical protein
MSNRPDEETDEPLLADPQLLRKVFAAAIKHRPRIRLTIRQRTRVLDRWPKTSALAKRS